MTTFGGIVAVIGVLPACFIAAWFIEAAITRAEQRRIEMDLRRPGVRFALREAAARGVKVRVWRDASEAARLGEFDVEAQLDRRVQGLEIVEQ